MGVWVSAGLLCRVAGCQHWDSSLPKGPDSLSSHELWSNSMSLCLIRGSRGVPGSGVCTVWHRGTTGTHRGYSSVQSADAMAMAQAGYFSSGNKEHH